MNLYPRTTVTLKLTKALPEVQISKTIYFVHKSASGNAFNKPRQIQKKCIGWADEVRAHDTSTSILQQKTLVTSYGPSSVASKRCNDSVIGNTIKNVTLEEQQ